MVTVRVEVHVDGYTPGAVIDAPAGEATDRRIAAGKFTPLPDQALDPPPVNGDPELVERSGPAPADDAPASDQKPRASRTAR